MADQRKNEGNIGDVVKHAILPELISIFDRKVKCLLQPGGLRR